MADKQRLLSALVGDLFRRHNATMADGVSVLSSMLIYSAVAGKIERADLIKVVELAWDELEPVYGEMLEEIEDGPPRGEDYQIEISPEVQAAMEKDPKMKEAVTDMIARLRQGFDASPAASSTAPTRRWRRWATSASRWKTCPRRGGARSRGTAARSSMAERDPRLRDEAYLAYIRTQPCCICGDDTSTEAAHVRVGSINDGKRYTGMQEKSHDKWALPLCSRHHRESHAYGDELGWWLSYGLNPFLLAMKYRAPGE